MQAVPQDNVQTSGGVRHKMIIYTAINIYWIIVISSTKNILLNISTTMSSLEHCTKMSFPSLLVPTTKTWKSKISFRVVQGLKTLNLKIDHHALLCWYAN